MQTHSEVDIQRFWIDPISHSSSPANKGQAMAHDWLISPCCVQEEYLKDKNWYYTSRTYRTCVCQKGLCENRCLWILDCGLCWRNRNPEFRGHFSKWSNINWIRDSLEFYILPRPVCAKKGYVKTGAYGSLIVDCAEETEIQNLEDTPQNKVIYIESEIL